MAKRRHQPKSRSRDRQVFSEDRRTEAVTVAWMLTTLVTFGALCVSGIGAAAMALTASPDGQVGPIQLIPGLLLAIATLTAVIGLVLQACTLQIRKTPPPRPVTIGAAIICLLPFGIHLILIAR